MQAIDNNIIYLTRGDTCVINLKVEDTEGNDYDYSGDTVLFTVKRNPNDKAIVIQKTFTDGKITLSPDDTEGVQFGQYYFDVQLTKQDGTVDTVIPCSIMNIMAEVTW